MSIDRVTEVLKQNPKGLGVTQIVKLTGLKRSEVSKAIAEMESKGVIEKIAKGCRVTYKLKQEFK